MREQMIPILAYKNYYLETKLLYSFELKILRTFY